MNADARADHDASSDSPSRSAQAIGSGLGALVGSTSLGPIVGAALTPSAIAYADKMLTEIARRRSHSVAMLLARAAGRLEVDPDDLQARAYTTADGEALFVDSVNAAADTIDQRKIAALAKALANGLAGDSAQIDPERLIVRTLAELEAPHLRILAVLPSNPGTRPKRSITQVHGAILATLNSLGLIVDDTREMARQADAELAERMLKVLKYMAQVQDARHLGRSEPSPPVQPSRQEQYRRREAEKDRMTPAWRRTPFGDRCLAYLWSAAEEAGLPTGDLKRSGR